MTGNRSWDFFAALAAAVAVMLGAFPVPVGASPALAPDLRCQQPKVTVKTSFAPVTVSYNLENQKGFSKAGKPRGWYRARHRIGYKGRIAKACLAELTVSIQVLPEIALRRGYKKKSGRCAGRIVLAHERRHGAIAKTEYAKLAKTIKKEILKMFTRVRVESFEAASGAIREKLQGGIYPRFRKSFAAAQARFHKRLRSAQIITKKCKLVKRK